jgi:hypothetical protein
MGGIRLKKIFIVIIGIVFLLIGCRETKLIPYEEGGTVQDELVQDGLIGYKDEHGKVVIKAKYIFAEEFSKYGIAAVCDHEKGWIYIDKKGELKTESPKL